MQIAPSTCEGVQVVTVPVLLDRCKILATFFNGELFPQGFIFEQQQEYPAQAGVVAAGFADDRGSRGEPRAVFMNCLARARAS